MNENPTPPQMTLYQLSSLVSYHYPRQDPNTEVVITTPWWEELRITGLRYDMAEKRLHMKAGRTAYGHPSQLRPSLATYLKGLDQAQHDHEILPDTGTFPTRTCLACIRDDIHAIMRRTA